MSNTMKKTLDEVPDKINELICFALYSANSAMNRAYKPYLSALGLTYPQYLALTTLWETDGVTVGTLCEKMQTETSTLTPLLKRLETQGHIKRKRGEQDERQVFIHLTESGQDLQAQAPKITACIVEETGLPATELPDLVRLIQEVRDNLSSKQKF
ncbi:MAG: MarR family winged helix-turn-helix transcriptional regulator [Hyphomicrobiales bacterium]